MTNVTFARFISHAACASSLGYVPHSILSFDQPILLAQSSSPRPPSLSSSLSSGACTRARRSNTVIRCWVCTQNRVWIVSIYVLSIFMVGRARSSTTGVRGHGVGMAGCTVLYMCCAVWTPVDATLANSCKTCSGGSRWEGAGIVVAVGCAECDNMA